MLVRANNFPDEKVIVANVFWLSLASIMSQGFIAVSLLITARSLGPADFGQYSACIALARLTSIAFNLGMDTWLLRAGKENEKSTNTGIAGILMAKTVLGTIWIVLLVIFWKFLNPLTYPLSVLFISAVVTWIESLLTTIEQGFNIFLKNYLSLYLAVIFSFGLFASTFGLASLNLSNPLLFLFARLFISLIATSIGLSWLTKLSPLRFSSSYIPIVLGQSIPFAISEALVVVYTQADITIVAFLLGSPSAGLYSSASGILRAAFVLPLAVFSVITPIISQMVSQNNWTVLIKTIYKTYISLSIMGLILWIGMRIAGPSFTQLILREKFGQAGNILAILSIILFLRCLNYASATILIAMNKHVWRVVAQWIAAFANIGLNFWAIPMLSLIHI